MTGDGGDEIVYAAKIQVLDGVRKGDPALAAKIEAEEGHVHGCLANHYREAIVSAAVKAGVLGCTVRWERRSEDFDPLGLKCDDEVAR